MYLQRGGAPESVRPSRPQRLVLQARDDLPPLPDDLALEDDRTGRSDPPSNVRLRPANRPSSRPPADASPAERLEALALEIAAAAPDDLEPLMLRSVRAGPGLVPLLAREFPGILWIEPAQIRPRTRAVQLSACCAVMAGFGADAADALAGLLASGAPRTSRLCAARVAVEAPHGRLVRPLVSMVAEDDPEIGDAAMPALRAHEGVGELGAMLARLRDALSDRGSPPYWRIVAARTFGRLRDRGAVPSLIDALADDGPIAAAAREALRTITARDHGAYRVPWMLWWRSNERRPRGAWLLDALDQDGDAMRARALAELVLLTGADLGRRAAVRREDAGALRAALEPAVRALEIARG